MLKTKDEKLITAGEFATLAQSTKRTIHWYTEHGLLHPKKINSKGYRFYSIDQIVDLQAIMLLRELNFSIPEIKKFLRKNASTKDIFIEKRQEILEEISSLQQKLKNITEYYTNLDKEGVFIKPIIKEVPAFKSFILEKTGPYSQIENYCLELKNYFAKLPKDAIFFVIFPDREYAPKKDRLKIGVVIKPGMKLRKDAEGIVQEETIPSFKSMSYRLIGNPALISMVIMQMHKYMDTHGIKQNMKLPINELEFYIKSSLTGATDRNRWVSEMNIPIV